MLAQAAGRVHELGSHVQQVAPAGGVVGVQLLGQQRQLIPGQSQVLAQILDDALDLVGGVETAPTSTANSGPKR